MWDEKYNGQKFIHQDSDEYEEEMTLDLETLSSFFNNDEYLYNQSEKLFDMTSPITRKRFTPVTCNQNKSFGVMKKGNYYVMDDRTHLDPPLRIGSSDTTFIDFNKTTVKMNHDHKFAPPYLPVKRKNLNTATRTYFNKKGRHGHINEYWYVSYKKGKPYAFNKKWMQHDDRKMSAVCRGQTFVPKISGYLEEVSLKIKSPKHPAHPLIVEIVKTNNHKKPYGRNTIRKDKKNKDPSKHKLLARTTLKSHGTSASLRTVKFRKPPFLKKGEYYAIVLRSPFTRARDPYWVGGWTKWCKQSRQKGNAYTSTDNGWHWVKHGKVEKTSRRHGRWAPTNFYYICGIRPVSDSPVPKEGNFYLYTKLISLNPIKSLQIYSTKYGNIHFEVLDNVSGTWQIMEGDHISYTKFNVLPTQIVVRAVFIHKGDTIPILDYFDIAPTMEKPKDAILRTAPYAPRLEGLLGASIYSKINAPYLINNAKRELHGVSVKVDVVRETNYAEYIELIHFRDICDYDDVNIVRELLNNKLILSQIETIISTTDESKYVEGVNRFLNIFSTVRKELRSEGIYIIEDKKFKSIFLENNPSFPLSYISFQPEFEEDEEYDKYEDLSDRIKENQDLLDLYDAGILEKDDEAYKKIEVDMKDKNEEISKLNIDNDDKYDGFDLTEFLDYSINYKTGEIKFTESTLNKIKKPGYFFVEYNPCFIKGLTNEDFPIKTDLFEEYYVVDDENKSMLIELRVPALDPIRKVRVEKYDSNEEITLVEDEDFVVDYLERIVKILPHPDISNKDLITVKYTPYLVDDAISLLYRIHRDDTEDDIRILPNYIEYKT